jgi:hypothetical protein
MNKSLATILIVLALFLFGCGSTQSSQEGDINYKTGTQGVEMNFMDNMPANVVYDGDVFNIGMEMWNRGTEQVPDGVFYLSGFDRSIITAARDANMPVRSDVIPIPNDGSGVQFTFMGDSDMRTQYNREGGYRQYLFTGAVVLPRQTTRLNVPIRVDACYLYNTEASVSLCLDPQPWKTNFEKACNAGAITGTGSQGAPVSISGVEQESVAGGKRLRLKVTVTNSGSGTLLDPAYAIPNCPNLFNPLDINRVEVESVTLAGNLVNDCKPQLINMGNSGTGYFYCEDIPISQQDNSYITTLIVKLRYGYKVSIQKNIELRSTGG